MLKVCINSLLRRAKAWRERVAAGWTQAKTSIAAALAGARRRAGMLAGSQVRERALAAGVFAGLALFAAASANYLVTGGPDWNPSAEAAPYVADNAYIVLTALPEIAYVAPAPVASPDAAPAEESTPAAFELSDAALLGGPDGSDLAARPAPGKQSATSRAPAPAKPKI